MLKKATLFFITYFIIITSFAQDKRSSQNIVNSKDTNLIISIIKLFKGKPNSLIDSTNLIINKSINFISSQEGKRINSIQITHSHFGTFTNRDSSNKQKFISKVANSLHDFTNENTIRKNLFFHVNEYMNPLVIAYNEKRLRDLPYIQDARIIAIPVLNDSNSVDLFVVTNDIFPFGASLRFKNINSYDASGTIENINDQGNALTLNHNFDINRKNKSGWGGRYVSRNLLGSFVDLTLGANALENNIVNFESSGTNIYVKGDLPLLSPLSSWTGGFEWSGAQNNNEFPNRWSDSLFNADLKYERKNFDSWIGYQIFNKPWVSNNKSYRHFIQYRYLATHFDARPINYLSQIDRNYQNVKAHLLSYTFFKQQIVIKKFLSKTNNT